MSQETIRNFAWNLYKYDGLHALTQNITETYWDSFYGYKYVFLSPVEHFRSYSVLLSFWKSSALI